MRSHRPISRCPIVTEHIVLGVDGGGSSTRVAVATASGELLGVGMSGAGNFHDVGVTLVRQHIEEALAAAWQQAGQLPRNASVAFLGLGSVASHSDRETIRQLAQELQLAPPGNLGVDHDLSIALAGGLAGQPGIVLIVGTGCASFGKSLQGDTWRAGGWGPTLDDVGSSGWLGLQAMVATVRQFDGRGSRTVLSNHVFESLGLSDIQEILWKVDGAKMTRREMAAMARHVTAAAEAGDEVARGIITRGAGELALLPATVAEKLRLRQQLETVPLAIAGGLTKAGPFFTTALHDAIRRKLPEVDIMEPRCQPVLGAVLLAIEQLTGRISPQVVDNLLLSHVEGV